MLLALTRQDVPTLDRTRFASAEGVRRGAYVLSDACDGAPALILIASGSEVGLVVAAAERLDAEGVAVRCVSMPSWDLFERQPQSYRDAVLPPAVTARLAVELGVAQGWHRYVGDAGDVSRSTASAPRRRRRCCWRNSASRSTTSSPERGGCSPAENAGDDETAPEASVCEDDSLRRGRCATCSATRSTISSTNSTATTA